MRSWVCAVFGRRFLAVALAAVMVLGGGLVVFVAAGSTSVSAQGTLNTTLEESECRTGGYFQGAVSEFDQVVEECRSLVRLRNYHVAHEDSGMVSGSRFHTILRWGASGTFIDCADSSCSGWSGVTLGSLPGSSELAVTELQIYGDARLFSLGLGGEIQANELCGLTRLTRLELADNLLSGTIPECLGNLGSLRTLSLQLNRLSGPIPASIAESNLNSFLAWRNDLTGALPAGFNQAYLIDLGSNALSGVLPADFGRADGYTVILNLFGNDFEGPIPLAWTTRFTKITTFSLANNRLTAPAGDNWINDWINSIEFVDTVSVRHPAFILEGNEICYSSAPELEGNQPRPFDSGGSFTGDYSGGGNALMRSASGGSRADFSLGSQNCLFEQQSYSNFMMPAPTNVVPNLVITTSTLPASASFEVAWTPPSDDGVIYMPTDYSVQFRLRSGASSVDNGCLEGDDAPLWAQVLGRVGTTSTDSPPMISYRYPSQVSFLAAEDGKIFDSSGMFTFGDSSFSLAADSRFVEPQTQCRALLARYFASVVPIYSVSQGGVTNVFRGEISLLGGTVTGWRAFNVTAVGAAKDASQLARDLGVPEGDRMFSWDAPNQVWRAHSAVASSGALAAGTAVMFQEGVAREADLAAAGVGRADEDIVVTLHQGWNLMAPELLDVDGDGEADDFDDRSQAATLFDSSLSDCDNTLGVQALATYDLLTESFNLFLPCLGDVSVPGYGQLSEIDAADSLFVFFQSQLPVPITWDPVTGQYTPSI